MLRRRGRMGKHVVFLSQVRFGYKNMTLAGFIAMSSEWSEDSPHAVIRKFRHALLAVPGVTQVTVHPEGTKKQQNNGGSHEQEHNFVVYTENLDNTGWSSNLRATIT